MNLKQQFGAYEHDDLLATKVDHFPPTTVEFNKDAWSKAFLGDTSGPLAYALNLPMIGDAKPGHLSRPSILDDASTYRTPFPSTRIELQERLAADNLLYLGDALPQEDHVIAFFARPEAHPHHNEMVIARRDSNGLWSTKTSGGCGKPFYPTQTDFREVPIVDPRDADFCTFTNFLGFASIPFEGIRYYPRLHINSEGMTPFSNVIPAKDGFHCS